MSLSLGLHRPEILPFSRLTDKALKDYSAYRSSLLFWALVDLIYGMFKVRRPWGAWLGLAAMWTAVWALCPALASGSTSSPEKRGAHPPWGGFPVAYTPVRECISTHGHSVPGPRLLLLQTLSFGWMPHPSQSHPFVLVALVPFLGQVRCLV